MSRPVFLIQLKWRQHRITPCFKELQGTIKVRLNWKFATVFTSKRNRILNEENRGHGLFFLLQIDWMNSFRNEHWQLEGRVKDVTLMPKPSYWCHERRPIILERRSIFQIWIKDYEGKYLYFCGLTCMNELFTTKIAMCANNINIQVHLKKNEYHEKGQYFLLLISESETHIYRLISKSETGAKSCWKIKSVSS